MQDEDADADADALAGCARDLAPEEMGPLGSSQAAAQWLVVVPVASLCFPVAARKSCLLRGNQNFKSTLAINFSDFVFGNGKYAYNSSKLYSNWIHN